MLIFSISYGMRFSSSCSHTCAQLEGKILEKKMAGDMKRRTRKLQTAATQINRPNRYKSVP